MKKILCLALALVMAMSLATVAWGVTGTGTVDDPYVVDSSDEIKSILDDDVDGVTIKLNAGTYEGLTFTNPATYKAKNVTIIGGEGVIVDGITFNDWNPRDISLKVDGFTIKNVTFTKGVLLSTVDMKNVTIENCAFTNDACIHQNDGSEKVTNLVVKGCSFEGIDDGDETTTAIMLENAETVTVSSCSFTNIDYNVMQAGVLSGDVLFENNMVNDTGNRAFRFVTIGSNAEFTINNNVILNGSDSNGEVIKVTSVDTSATVNLESNYWGVNDLSSAIINFNANVLPTIVGITGGTWDTDVSAYLADGYIYDSATGEVGTPAPTPAPTPTPSYPYYPPVVEDTKVDSAQTFDAGIALYVGVSVLGAVGAVSLSKKRED